MGIKIGSVCLSIIIILVSVSLYADHSDSELQNSFTYRTDDSAFHKLLQDRRERGCETIKNRLPNKNFGFKLSKAFGLSAPTSNMFDYDINHYRIDIELDFTFNTIESVVDINIKSLTDNLTYVDLTFHDNFTINFIKVDDQSVSSLHNGDLLTVYLPQTYKTNDEITIQIGYQGTPQFITNNSTTGGGLSYASQFTSQICQTECEPFGARNWFPCKDFPFDKADSVDLLVTHPSAMTTSANGLLQSINDNGDGTKTTHWKTRYPITTYVIHFVCAYQNLYEQEWEYAEGNFMPVVVYAYNGYSWGVNNYLTYTIPGLDVLSELFCLYPFVDEKYGNSFYDLWGMENQTMTVLIPDLAYEDIIIHEMAHHWWGNLITCRDFHHIWLNEGFATYTEALYYEYLYGSDYYHDYILNYGCLNAGSVYVEDLDNDQIFNATTSYFKGCRVLHMLRHVVGDEDFFTIMQNYANDPELRYKDAVTADFQAHCEAVYGESLDWFFEQWIYEPGNPHYEYGYLDYYDSDADQYKLALKIVQTQEGDPHYYPLFEMPVDIKVTTAKSVTTQSVFNNNRSQVFILDIDAEVDTVVIDPDDWILCTKNDNLELQFASITPTTDTAYLDQYYSLAFDAIGGTPPYSWTRISGQYPYGVSFSEEGGPHLEGYPNFSSDFVFRMRVEDSSNPTLVDSVDFKITVTESMPFICGDANSDTQVDISDAVFIINLVFVPGAPEPDPYESANVNCDDTVDISDAVYLINLVFVPGSPQPCDCG